METLLSAMQPLIGSNRSAVHLKGDFASRANAHHSGNASLVTPPNTTLSFSEGPTLATDSPSSNLQNPIFSSVPATSPHSPDERLNFFKSKMLSSFPFIGLTPEMTSLYLRQNRPLLYQAIRAVTTFSTQERLIQVEELKQELFKSAFLKVESTIDLLLATLTYLSWSTDPFLGRADLVSRLMMLAISLVYDLRLFKPSSEDVQLIMKITQGGPDENHPTQDETLYGLVERQRAVLACFILSSKYAPYPFYLQK